MSQLKLIIDGKEIIARQGQTVLEAAFANGIEIPNLCYDPRLKPTGACRLCLVEIDGQRDPQAACTFEAKSGLVVRTNTEAIRQIRKTILELLFAEHKGRCTTCDENGHCNLQRYAYEYQLSEEIFAQPVYTKPVRNYTTDNLAMEYDPNKCIRCGRCIRICDEVQMAHALTFKNRAAAVEVSTAFDIPLHESTCVLCGQCISTCPTGALYERSAKGKGQAKDLVKTRTTCPYCGVGCQIDLNINPKTNRIVRVTSEVGCIPNNGNLCVKGRFGMDFVGHHERLTTPLIKRNGKFEKVTWQQAIKFVAERLDKIKSETGPDSIAGLSSAKCTNEDNYIFQKFMRAAIGTNNVDHCARLCHSSTVAGLAKAFGSGAMTNSIDEIKNSKCIFVIGSNTTEAHPIIALYIKEAVVKNGAKLIVADPRDIELVRYAALHLQQRPGTDVALINAMMNVIINENLLDRDFIDTRTENFEAVVETIKDITAEIAEKITTIPSDKIREAARIYATAETASIIFSMGITQHTTGTDNVLSLANLSMLTGNVGKEFTGINPLRGQNNVQGACDMGALPNVYTGYQPVENAEIRAKFEKTWGKKLPCKAGLTIIEMIHAIEAGSIKALYLMGENPALSDPNLNRTRKALEKVDFFVSQEILLSETAQFADVVLPSFCFAEKDGTFTNTERRIQLIRKALQPPGDAKDDWQILCRLATVMDYPMSYDCADKIMDEIATVTPIYGGISSDRLEPVGLQWPCPDKNHPGTKYLHKYKFTRGKGKFHAVKFIEPAENPDEEFPFILSTGRQLYQFHTGTLTRKSPAIGQKSPTGYVELNYEDAERYNITDGDYVEVATRRGKVVTKASVSSRVAKGWLFMPFHFAEGPANMLTNDALDPIAKIPEFKVCAASIKKIKSK
ncbi:MAG: formate dehydrogenase subunit alpha [Planctomycetes bacterium RBG_13_44_8b]|nr:MAG: formate dehydrogenase subunit alpha [Planctomycetes bacterium RBG_13_44_8b]